MNLSASDYQVLETLVADGSAMVSQLRPFAQACIEQPDREDIRAQLVVRGFELCHYIRGTAEFFHFAHLIGPVETIEYLLDQARSGLLLFEQAHAALVLDVCQFLEQGLPLVLREKNDTLLALQAGQLINAILQAPHMEQEILPVIGGGVEATHEMLESFTRESGELLSAAEQEFVLWDFIAIDHPRIQELARLLHRMHRGFALFDLKDLERISLAIALTLERYVQGECFQTEYPDSVFLRCLDGMREALERYALSGEAGLDKLDELLAALQGLIRQPLGTLLVEAGVVAPQIVEEALKVQRESRTEQPRRLGEVLVEMGKVTNDQVQEALSQQYSRRSRLESSQQEVKQAASTQERRFPLAAAYDELTVNGRVFTRMLDIIDMIDAEKAQGLPAEYFLELQRLASLCRTNILAGFPGRLKRLVHDIAFSLERKVHFSVEGEEYLLGYKQAPLLFDPLYHLVHNALEHGLEQNEERMAAGKGKTCRVSLSVIRQQEELWISVEDDGKGFELEKLRQKAVSQGLIGQEQSVRYSQHELIKLFVGSASSEQEHDIGGKGLIGVAKVVRQLHGKIDFYSRSGKGARVTLRIPLRNGKKEEKKNERGKGKI